MSIQPTYPGVYIEEIPSGVRTITGVSTSIAAFIGFFRRGPMNRAVQIFSIGDFEREFGGLDIRSEAGYAIQQFFLNGGSQAYAIRVASGSAENASVQLGNGSSALALEVEASQEGTWGNNVRVQIDYNVLHNNEFNLSIFEYNSAGNQALRQEVFLNLSIDPNSSRRNFVRDVINDANTGSKIVRVTDNPAAVLLPASNGTLSGEITAPVNLAAVPASMNISMDGGTSDLPLSLEGLVVGDNELPAIALSLENAIRTADLANPILANASVNVVGSRLQVLAGGDDPRTVLMFSDGISGDLELSGANAQPNVQEYVMGNNTALEQHLAGTSGDDGVEPNATAIIGSMNDKTGMFALEDIDLFNILCIPRTGATGGSNPMPTNEADAVLSAAIAYCESKRSFLIIDTPMGIDSLSEIQNWINGNGNLRHRNAAIYYPRVRIPDPLDNYRLRSVGACGTIAGLYARIDSNRGVWKAAAGTETMLRNVSELTDTLSERENGVLNPLGVNCLVNKTIYGNISWGGRTLEGADQMASEWKYIPVRRLALFLEESLFRGLQWAVFEPNDESLWAQIRLNVGAFMNNLFKQGAFQGVSSRDAYLVKCDRETTTQNDINLGIVNIVVGFAPLKPAEFVILKIQQLAGQVQA